MSGLLEDHRLERVVAKKGRQLSNKSIALSVVWRLMEDHFSYGESFVITVLPCPIALATL